MKYKVAKSSIQGKGLFAKELIRKGENIGVAHTIKKVGKDRYRTTPTSVIGKYHNHNEEDPTAINVQEGNKRYLIAQRDIKPGEEITTNYRLQPELEQPEDFKKGGEIPKVRIPTDKKGIKSKAYSRSLEATNRLFALNPLFDKPKSRKRKIFDPNASFYADGGVVSFDFDDTLDTDLGLQMAKNTPSADKYIISARPEVTPDMIARAREAGIPDDRIFAMGSDEAKVAKIRELGIDRHIDNKQSVVNKLGFTGQLFQNGGEPNSPQEWGEAIKAVEREVGNPDNWTYDDLSKLQGKLYEYKAWRENTPEGRAVIDYHNAPNEYEVPLPKHLNPASVLQKGGQAEYIELELTPEEIQAYRNGGYVVEELD